MNVPGMNAERDLEGLSALVTGATSSIGRAAAEELGRRGAEIVVHGRDAGRGAAVASTIAAAGGKARFVAADLTDPAQVDHLAEGAGWNQPGPTASPPTAAATATPAPPAPVPAARRTRTSAKTRSFRTWQLSPSSTSRSGSELIDMMMARYSSYGNAYTLLVAAASQFPR
jgi:hypothetical protein